jgi:hypothetical protein
VVLYTEARVTVRTSRLCTSFWFVLADPFYVLLLLVMTVEHFYGLQGFKGSQILLLVDIRNDQWDQCGNIYMDTTYVVDMLRWAMFPITRNKGVSPTREAFSTFRPSALSACYYNGNNQRRLQSSKGPTVCV